MGLYGFKESKSRKTAKLHDRLKSYNSFNTVFSKNSKNSNVCMWGVYPQGIDWNITLRTQISPDTEVQILNSEN